MVEGQPALRGVILRANEAFTRANTQANLAATIK